MIRRALVAAAAVLLPLVSVTPAAADGSQICVVGDPQLTEVSGAGVYTGRDQQILSVPPPRAARLAPTTAPFHSPTAPPTTSPAPGGGSSDAGIGWVSSRSSRPR